MNKIISIPAIMLFLALTGSLPVQKPVSPSFFQNFYHPDLNPYSSMESVSEAEP